MLQAVDSQECLDTVGPLPSGTSRPHSAALLRSGSSSPPKILQPTVAEISPASGHAIDEAAPLQDKLEVVVHEPMPTESRWDAVRRSSGDVSSSASTLHPLIQVLMYVAQGSSTYDLVLLSRVAIAVLSLRKLLCVENPNSIQQWLTVWPDSAAKPRQQWEFYE